MARAKESGQAAATDQLFQLARYGPGGIMAPISRLALRYRVSNVTITNVPGPDMPLYCMGAQLRDVAPYVGCSTTTRSPSGSSRTATTWASDWSATPT